MSPNPSIPLWIACGLSFVAGAGHWPSSRPRTVNGQPVTEIAVQRGLKRVPPPSTPRPGPKFSIT